MKIVSIPSSVRGKSMIEARPWEEVRGATGIFRAQYKVPLSTTYCTLVDLGGNRYMAYSPGPGLEYSLAGIVPVDAKLFLLAPSKGHALGIMPWSNAYPTADIHTSEGNLKKIARTTGLDSVRSVDELAPQLPSSIAIHIPPPHFLNEVWVSIKQDGVTYWLVSDAFLNFNKVEGNILMKFLLGLYGMRPGLRLHKLFPLGLDKAAFRRWAKPLFCAPGRHILLPCHRDIYDAPDCGEKLVSIANGTV